MVAAPIPADSIRRYHDPGTGQFISVDPAVDQTEAPYAYVNGDPVDSIDPLGLGWLQDAANGTAGFGDMITFAGAAWVRGQINSEFGLPNRVDYCSSWYQDGEFAGVGTRLFLGGYGLLGDAAEGGSFLERLRAIDWADETGSIGPSADFPDDLIPEGETRNSWGAKIWGRGVSGAEEAMGARTPEELRALGLAAEGASRLAAFYRSAAAAGRGMPAAAARAELMEQIARELGG